MTCVQAFAYDFFPNRAWCVRNGYASARAYWESVSGLTGKSINYTMYDGLGDLGYTGSITTRLKNYLEDQTGQTGSLEYLMNYFNGNVNVGGVVNGILLETGSYVLLENGSHVLLE